MLYLSQMPQDYYTFLLTYHFYQQLIGRFNLSGCLILVFMEDDKGGYVALEERDVNEPSRRKY